MKAAAAHRLGTCMSRRRSPVIKQINTKGTSDIYDLHGLYAREAARFVNEKIREARRDGKSSLRFIVGKGHHSIGSVPVIGPVIEALLRRKNIKYQREMSKARIRVLIPNEFND